MPSTAQRSSFTPHRDPLIALALEDHNLEQLHGILTVARDVGWKVVNLDFFEDDPPDEITFAGAIVSSLPGSSLVAGLRGRGCPVVRLGRLPHPGDAQLPAILPDLHATGSAAADHLIERGFSTLGYVGHSDSLLAGDLGAGFRRRAIGLGAHVEELELRSGRKFGQERLKEAHEWLLTTPRPIGLFVYDVWWAGRFCAHSPALGFAVPEDVAVLTHSYHPYANECSPVPLSNVESDHFGMGRRAALLLARLMAGEHSDSPIYCAPKAITTRRSTDIMAVDDSVVARALRFIWDHVGSTLSVSHVAEQLQVGRRRLERGFRRELDRSVHDEIRRKRLEKCAHLLLHTDQSVQAISEIVGYSTRNSLHRAFREFYGCTPAAYRRAQSQQQPRL